jgi:hypothetical protein
MKFCPMEKIAYSGRKKLLIRGGRGPSPDHGNCRSPGHGPWFNRPMAVYFRVRACESNAGVVATGAGLGPVHREVSVKKDQLAESDDHLVINPILGRRS